MKGGQPGAHLLCAAVAFFLSGCAIGGATPQTATAPIAERDLLAEAAQDVEKSKWRTPESAPMLSWITGGAEHRFTKSDAVAFYVDSLGRSGGFQTLLADADRKLADAARFHAVAVAAVDAPRVSARDVALVEECIQSLRQQRDIYAAAAVRLEHAGAPVDDAALAEMREKFHVIVRALGDAADELADRYEKDRSETYASPGRTLVGGSAKL